MKESFDARLVLWTYLAGAEALPPWDKWARSFDRCSTPRFL